LAALISIVITAAISSAFLFPTMMTPAATYAELASRGRANALAARVNHPFPTHLRE
jgi:hypothetical protein